MIRRNLFLALATTLFAVFSAGANPALIGAMVGGMAPFLARGGYGEYLRLTYDSTLLRENAADSLLLRIGFKPSPTRRHCYQEPVLEPDKGIQVCYVQAPFVPDYDSLWIEPDGLWPDTQHVRPPVVHARFGFTASGDGSLPLQSVTRLLFAEHVRTIAPNRFTARYGWEDLRVKPAKSEWWKAGFSATYALHDTFKDNLYAPPKGFQALLYTSGALFDVLAWAPLLIGALHPDLTPGNRLGLFAVSGVSRLVFNVGLFGTVCWDMTRRHNRFAEAGLRLPVAPQPR